MIKIFGVSLKFHPKYLTHTLKDANFIQCLKCTSSYYSSLRSKIVFETPHRPHPHQLVRICVKIYTRVNQNEMHHFVGVPLPDTRESLKYKDNRPCGLFHSILCCSFQNLYVM